MTREQANLLRPRFGLPLLPEHEVKATPARPGMRTIEGDSPAPPDEAATPEPFEDPELMAAMQAAHDAGAANVQRLANRRAEREAKLHG